MQILLEYIVPNTWFDILPALTLIGIGIIIEKYYVSRIAIFSNAIALSSFYVGFSDLPLWLTLYINVLIIVGVICLISYLTKDSMPKEFYKISGLFSSFISGIVLFYGLTL